MIIVARLGAVVCYVLLGTPAGYTSARLYKSRRCSPCRARSNERVSRSVRRREVEEECTDDSRGMSRVSHARSEFRSGSWSIVHSRFSVIFGIFFILNIVLWSNGSSAAIPFSTFLALLALWFCVSTPLVFIGAYLGFKRPVCAKKSRCDMIVCHSHTRAGVGQPRANESDSSTSARTELVHEAIAR